MLCNGGGHGHDGHHHGHHHHHPEGVEDLESLIQNFGIAVLGKDQESANDVQPTADHSHVNIKVRRFLRSCCCLIFMFQALINELFHPSTTSTTTTTTPATTSTQRLPIKSHDLGWDLSPIDLVMSNSILEPVFSPEQKQHLQHRSGPTYLTETPYLARDDDDNDDDNDDDEVVLGDRRQPLRSGKSLNLIMNLHPEQLIDKPTLPVLDTRRANFILGWI